MTVFKEYRDEINRIFSRYTRGGFVDYYHCRGLGHDMIDLMIDATEELSFRGEYKELFALANKGFLKWGKTDKDDSDGETQDFIYYIKQAWDVVYDSGEDKIPHGKMYDWFEKHTDGSVIDYMEEQIYEYMMSHFKEPELLQKKYDLLNRKTEEGVDGSDSSYVKYQMDRWREYQLRLMADMKKPIEEIREYAKMISSYSVQETMAEIERAYGNTNEVIAIYQELAAQEDARGWARENWHLKLKDIYKESGDEEKYRAELLSAMTLDVGNEDLWKEYKGCCAPEDWPTRCEDLFSSVKVGDYRIFPWYAQENRYDLVMDGVEVGGHIDRLKQYEKKLKELYPDRCLTVLLNDTKRMAEQSNKRQDYRRVARNLRWIQQYPNGKTAAAELAQEFRLKYKRKRAMMEEILEF